MALSQTSIDQINEAITALDSWYTSAEADLQDQAELLGEIAVPMDSATAPVSNEALQQATDIIATYVDSSRLA